MKKLRITIENEGDNYKKFISELPWDSDMYDILDAFIGMCVSLTFVPETVYKAMYEVSESALDAQRNEE